MLRFCEKGGLSRSNSADGSHSQDMTGKYPDILHLMPQLLSPIAMNDDGDEEGVQSFIIDAEIVAIDPVTKALLTFQTLTNRARKDVNIHEVKVKVGVFAFDLMYLNGKVSDVAPILGDCLVPGR